MPAWDYLIVSDPTDLHTEGKLDALGAEGWELAGFDPRGVGFFKRPTLDAPKAAVAPKAPDMPKVVDPKPSVAPKRASARKAKG